MRREELGAERELFVRADDAGLDSDNVFLDDQRDTFVRFLVLVGDRVWDLAHGTFVATLPCCTPARDLRTDGKRRSHRC